MDRSFDKRFLIGIVLVVVLLVGDAGLDYYNTRELHEDAARVAQTHAVLEALEDVVSTMKDAETGQRGYIITGEPTYLEPYNDAVAAIDQKVDRLKELTADNPRQQAQFPALEHLIALKLQVLERKLALRKEDPQAERRTERTGEGRKAMDGVRGLVSEMEQEERDLLLARERQTNRRYWVAQTMCLLTAGLGLVMLAGFVYLLRRHLLEREKAAAVVHEQREWFRTTLASIGDAVIATDTKGRVSFLNAVAESLTGWKEDEALGTSLDAVFKVVHEHTRQPLENPAIRALQDGAAVGLANHALLLGKQGDEVPIDDSASPIRGARGNVAGVVLVFRDVTERRRAEAERERRAATMEQRVEGLTEADRLKNEFLAMLAHELRNPLAPIRNALHLIQKQVPERNDKLQEPLGIIERQVEALVRLVDDLLDVSRITRGKIKLQKESVEVATIVNRAVESSRPLIDARNHELDVSLPDKPALVKADVTRMAQVVLNLLNNAAKYTPEGGHIWLKVRQEDGQVAIRVRDNGMGIPADVLPSVFDLFAQSARTLDQADGGLGIGLTLAHRLTELHGGSVMARSEGPGQGSEFVVRLPLLPDQDLVASAGNGPDARGPVERLSPHGLSKHRVLVVDDNRDSAASLATLLRLTGHDVRTVHDGRQALAIVEAYRPSLILLDIGLPGMDGYAVARQIRSQPQLAGTVLVALTGYGSEEHRLKSQAAGFDHHLVKPAEFGALQDLLDAFAPRAVAAATAPAAH